MLVNAIKACGSYTYCFSWALASKCGQPTSFLQVLLWYMFFRIGWTGHGGLLSIFIGFMIFITQFLDDARMSKSISSSLVKLCSRILCPWMFSLIYWSMFYCQICEFVLYKISNSCFYTKLWFGLTLIYFPKDKQRRLTHPSVSLS